MSGPRESRLPAGLGRARDLTRSALDVLITLGEATDAQGWCRRSIAKLADELGYARRTVQRALRELEQAGYLEIQEQRSRNGGPGAHRFRIRTPDQAPQLTLFDPPPADVSQRLAEAEGGGDIFVAGVATSHVARVATSGVARVATSDVATGTTLLNDNLNEAAAAARESVPVASSEIDQAGLDALERELRAAAAPALNEAWPGLISLAEPLSWLRSGCSLRLDVIPAIKACAARRRPGSVRSWGYFADAVIEARDRRLLARPPPEGWPAGVAAFPARPPPAVPSPAHPSTSPGVPHHADHHAADAQRRPDRKVRGGDLLAAVAAAALRREGGSHR